MKNSVICRQILNKGAGQVENSSWKRRHEQPNSFSKFLQEKEQEVYLFSRQLIMWKSILYTQKHNYVSSAFRLQSRPYRKRAFLLGKC